MRFLILTMFLFFPTVVLPGGEGQTYKIYPSGRAEFFPVGRPNEVTWVVQCSRPMRDCIARSWNVVLRIYDRGPGLLLYAPPHSNVLVFDENGVSAWAASKFQHLDSNEVATLDDAATKISISTGLSPGALQSVAGIEHVISYLEWLETDVARAIRNPQLWSGLDDLNVEELEGESMLRYQELLRRRAIVVRPVEQQSSMVAIPVN